MLQQGTGIHFGMPKSEFNSLINLYSPEKMSNYFR